ncbi:hypothetical protein Poli38472_002334 [Pythium oligandrum]|uniref:NAD-dependent epimerase/dehydratase domain-containing protein n=1 Tax=Pythium oligandrum TaxID=41045 RepID=A0A8K1CI47_PYTOL|nr:hypothetical protein Poli38472_002334 [Pythium oligandrum]|eukprot:TMW63393.1 hypothetical protein Poli38472_002334 [Pythium oligandrum]
MLPSTMRRKSADRGWMLLPSRYVYIGVAFFFILGSFFGYSYNATSAVRRTMSGATAGYAITAADGRPTVMVTGGLGFIGSHVVEDLLDNGFHVVIYDDMSNGKNFNRGTEAVLVKDITVVNDYETIVHKIDYIVHLAAAISVEESTRLPEKYERINVEGSRKVLEWALKNGVKRVVAASSGATYGTPLPENLPLREESATGGICAYATTKFKMEKLMNEYNVQYGLPSTALRFFNVYGPRQDPHSSYSGVVSWMMEQAKINGTLKVTGDGDQYRDFVFVKDVARAIRLAMLLPDRGFDVFNVCTGVKTTINSVAEQIVEKFQSTAAIKHIPWRQGDVRESVCSPTKAQNKLGFSAAYTFSDGIAATRDWFLGRTT